MTCQLAKMHNDKDANNKDIKTGKGWGIKIRSDGDVWFIVGSRRHRDDRTRAGAGSLKAGEWAHIAVTWDNRKPPFLLMVFQNYPAQLGVDVLLVRILKNSGSVVPSAGVPMTSTRTN